MIFGMGSKGQVEKWGGTFCRIRPWGGSILVGISVGNFLWLRMKQPPVICSIRSVKHTLSLDPWSWSHRECRSWW